MVVAAVIGAAGRMGSWFADFLSKSGYRLILTDRNKSAARRLARKHNFRFVEDQATVIESAQIVVLATPTHTTRRILERLDKETSRGKLFVEISSVKRPLSMTLRKAERRGISVLSIHPMFGPSAEGISGKTILSIPTARRTRPADAFLTMLRRRGAKVVRCDLNEHDRLMSVVLTLPHFLNVVLANTLRSIGTDPNLLSKIAGPTFRLQLLIAEAVHHESLDSELSILMDDAYSDVALKKYAKQSTIMLNTIVRAKRDIMMRQLREGCKFLQKSRSFASSYRRFSEAVAVSDLD
jgi:chorismate mutase/prephenate dehydrogenase